MGTKHGGAAWAGRGSGPLLGNDASPTDWAPSPIPQPSRENQGTLIDEAIDRKASLLEPPAQERKRLDKLKIDVQRTLSAEMSVTGINVIGSVAKRTQIQRPDGNDIDLQLRLDPGTYRHWRDEPEGAKAVLTKIKTILDRDPRYQGAEVHVDRNVVTVTTGGSKVDIAPSFDRRRLKAGETDSMSFPHLGEDLPASPTKIPDTSGFPHWIETDPMLSTRYMRRIDRRFGGEVVLLNRIAKRVNDRNGRILSSHHLECLTLEYFHQKRPSDKNTHRANVRAFFRDLPWLLRNGVSDPISHERADSYLDEESRRRAIKWAKRELKTIEKAEQLARSGRTGQAADIYGGMLDE